MLVAAEGKTCIATAPIAGEPAIYYNDCVSIKYCPHEYKLYAK